MVDDIGDFVDIVVNIVVDMGICGYSFVLDNIVEKFFGLSLIFSGSVYFLIYYWDS